MAGPAPSSVSAAVAPAPAKAGGRGGDVRGAFSGSAAQRRPVPAHVLDSEYDLVHQVGFLPVVRVRSLNVTSSVSCCWNRAFLSVARGNRGLPCRRQPLWHPPPPLLATHQRATDPKPAALGAARQAFATDASDQSPWMYYRWLLGNSLASVEAEAEARGGAGAAARGEEARLALGEVRGNSLARPCRVTLVAAAHH